MISVDALSKLAVVDVETSGLNPYRHQILSLAVVPLLEAKPILELYVAHPEVHWEPQAEEYFSGSWDLWRAEGLSPSNVCTAISAYVQDVFRGSVTLLGHNVGFDMAFLRQLAFLAGLDEVPMVSHRTVDTHTILYLLHLAGVVPQSALSSDGAFEYFGIDVLPAERHTARADAIATRQLFLRALDLWSRLMRDHSSWPPRATVSE